MSIQEFLQETNRHVGRRVCVSGILYMKPREGMWCGDKHSNSCDDTKAIRFVHERKIIEGFQEYFPAYAGGVFRYREDVIVTGVIKKDPDREGCFIWSKVERIRAFRKNAELILSFG